MRGLITRSLDEEKACMAAKAHFKWGNRFQKARNFVHLMQTTNSFYAAVNQTATENIFLNKNIQSI